MLMLLKVLVIAYLIGSLISALLSLIYTRKVNEYLYGLRWMEYWTYVDLVLTGVLFLLSWVGVIKVSRELWRIK